MSLEMFMTPRFCRMLRSRLARLAALLLVISAASAGSAVAQTAAASLNGVVTDPSQAHMPGVTVTVRNQATLETRDATTDSEGRFAFAQLPPGMYEVTAEITGFKRFRQVDLPLRATQAAELAIVLEVGGLSDEVTVLAPAVALETRSANQSVTLPSRLVSDLPQGTRTPFFLVNGLAGTTNGSVARGIGSNQNANLDQLFNGFGLNGGRDFSNLILIDGVPATAGDWNGLIVSPSPDSVEEMQVIRNAYDAQFGRSGGGVVNLVTKSGSSAFHGGGWEFFRNQTLDANSWQNNAAGVEKTKFSRNQYGGQFGGPIWRDKRLFFYGSYEGLHETTPYDTGFERVPTDLERRGDFSQTRNPDGSLAVIYNPFTTRPDPDNPGVFLRDPFPGNMIPARMIDPVAANVLALYPLPNRPGDPITSAGNFFASGTGKNLRDEFDARIDWARSAKHTMYGRVSVAPRASVLPPDLIGNGLTTSFFERSPRYHASINNTFIPNDRWVIDVLVGGGHWDENHAPASVGVIDAAAIGLSNDLFQAPIIPQFNVGGYLTLGYPQIERYPRTTGSLQANVTRQSGSHTLRFGLWAETNLVNNINRYSADFGFGRGMTSGPVAQVDSSESGDSLASFLLGTGDGGSSQYRADLAGSLRYYAGYVQDVWTVNNRLTVNAGLRYEIQRPATERYDRVAWFNPDVANPIGDQVGLPLKGGFEFATADDRGQWKQDWNDLAPRIGVAYKWTDKLVTRAGYGMFYAASSSLYTFDPVPGVSNSTSWVASNGFVPVDLLSNPFPNGTNKAGEGNQGLLTNVGFFLDRVWLRDPHPTPYKHQYSVDLQYQLGPATIVEIGYSGFRGRNLLFGEGSSYNQLDPNYLSLGDALNEQVPNPFFGVITEGDLQFETVPRQRLLRPFPQFTDIYVTRSLPGATSSFDALNLKFARAFSDGFSAIVTYQFSKNMDNASEDQGWATGDAWRDAYNKELERSVSAHDVPHSFAMSLLYELPFGRERKFANSMSPAAEAVLGGWQVASIIRLGSGYPYSISAPNTLGDYGFHIMRPNQVGDPSVSGSERTPENFFDRSAFQDPPPYTIGNAPRYPSKLREEPLRIVDFTASKRVPISGGTTVEFRADFLNLFNHPQFGSLSTFTGDERYGQATGVVTSPRSVQMGLKVTF
jgi:outer membrane receptor protein involved in Fe transport